VAEAGVTLRLATPAALWALLAVPLFLTRRAPVAGALRALAAATLVVVLAGPSVERLRPAAGACVVAAVDVSTSVERAAADAAREWLAALAPVLRAEDLVGTVAFAGHARVVAHPAERRALADLLPAGDPDGVEAGETDLAGGVAAAAALCPADRQAALLLFTDGNETAGSLLAEAGLMEPRVPIFPVVPATSRLPPAAVRRLVAPAFVPAHAVLPLEAVLEGHGATAASVALDIHVNGGSLVPVPVEIGPGTSVVRLPYSFEAPGTYLLEAGLLLPSGARVAGSVAAAVTVTRPVHVLVVSERERPVVALALVQRGMDVELTAPAGLAAWSGRLADFHLVVLDDVGSAGVSAPALEALAAWVAGGGALVATGGGHLFGDAGYVGSALERVLPVALQSQRPEPKEREPIALYLVIDRSNSMGYTTGPGQQFGDKMEYAKRAALAVLEQLGPGDLVGAIAFDSQPHELGPLRPVAEGGPALAAQIQRLRYGGGTDFKDALELALKGLLATEHRVRHVILLTDGDTNRRTEDHYQVIDALARADVTVTTIRIGDDTANLELLHAIAGATGGQFHHIERVQALPQLMISDARRLIDTASGRLGAPVHIGSPGPILAGFTEAELPPVAHWAVTRPKPDADIRLYVDADDRREPLLATWRYQLGHAAVLPLDFQAGAATWAAWGGFGKLWAQLAVWASPAGLATDRHVEVRREAAGAVVEVQTLEDEAAPPTLTLDDGPEVVLRPSARRTFTAVIPGLDPGHHAAHLARNGASEPLDLVVPERSPSGRERRGTGPNRALLEQLAAETGGRVDPAPADVLRARPGTRRRSVPLDGLLVPLALALVLADVALRRFSRA
jgi:Ca-activated chloride channel family protein